MAGKLYGFDSYYKLIQELLEVENYVKLNVRGYINKRDMMVNLLYTRRILKGEGIVFIHPGKPGVKISSMRPVLHKEETLKKWKEVEDKLIESLELSLDKLYKVFDEVEDSLLEADKEPTFLNYLRDSKLKELLWKECANENYDDVGSYIV